MQEASHQAFSLGWQWRGPIKRHSNLPDRDYIASTCNTSDLLETLRGLKIWGDLPDHQSRRLPHAAGISNLPQLQLRLLLQEVYCLPGRKTYSTAFSRGFPRSAANLSGSQKTVRLTKALNLPEALQASLTHNLAHMWRLWISEKQASLSDLPKQILHKTKASLRTASPIT